MPLALRQTPQGGFCPLTAALLSFPPFSSHPQLYEMFSSVMKHLPGPQQQAFKELQGLEEFITKKVEQNQRTLDPNSPRDFIDSFLIKMLEVNPEAKERGRRFKARQGELRLEDGELIADHSSQPLIVIPACHHSLFCLLHHSQEDGQTQVQGLVIATYLVPTTLERGCVYKQGGYSLENRVDLSGSTARGLYILPHQLRLGPLANIPFNFACLHCRFHLCGAGGLAFL